MKYHILNYCCDDPHPQSLVQSEDWSAGQYFLEVSKLPITPIVRKIPLLCTAEIEISCRHFLQWNCMYRIETCINISLFIGNWLVKLDNSLCQQEDQIIFVLGRDFQPSKLHCGEIFNINRANSVRRNKQRTSISQHFTLIDRTQSSVQQDRRQGRWPLWPISYSDHNSNFLVAAESGKNTSLYSCMMWGVL